MGMLKYKTRVELGTSFVNRTGILKYLYGRVYVSVY